MIEVDLPDGSVAEFPDGTAPDVIKGALRKRYNMPPVAEDAGMFKNASGVTGEATAGPITAPEQTPNIAHKGDMAPNSRAFPDPFLGRAQGATFNFGDELGAGIKAGVDTLMGRDSGMPIAEKYAQGKAGLDAQLAAAREYRPLETGVQEVIGGIQSAGVPLGALTRGTSLGGAMLRSGVAGSLLGGASGFGAGEDTESRLEGAKTGAAIGGSVGTLGPVVGALLSKAISPFRVPAARTQMADILRNEGVDLTAGQRTGSNALRYAESEIGGNAAANMMERQGEQFTAAALRRAGTTANRATPDVIDDTFHRVGGEFDGLAQRNQLRPDRQLVNDLGTVVNEYNSLVPQTQRAPIIQNVVDDILNTVRLNGPNGTNSVQGASYQSLRSALDRAARGSKDPQLSGALRGLRDTLDDAMERSIGRSNPNDLGAWREARRQYRNLLVIERAATGAGENSAMGILSPSQLRNATVQQNRRGYARGRGDFADLARAGEALMKPLPNSGTPGRTAVRALGTSVPALLGAGSGATMGGPLGAVAGSLAGAALPKIVGALMMSRPGQAYLSNQVAANPALRNIVSALLVSGSTGSLTTP